MQLLSGILALVCPRVIIHSSLNFPFCCVFVFVMAVYDLDSFMGEVRTVGFDKSDEVIGRAFNLMKANGLECLSDIAGTCFVSDWSNKEGVDAGLIGFVKQLILHQTNKFQSNCCASGSVAGAAGANLIDAKSLREEIGNSFQEALSKKDKGKKRVEIQIVLAVCCFRGCCFCCVRWLCFCHVQEKVDGFKLDKIPQEMLPSAKSVDIMASDVASMDASHPVKFVHTSLKHFLPIWLMDKPKMDEGFLMPTNLWSPAYMRWSFAADAAGMVRLSDAFALHDLCMRLTDEQKKEGRSTYIAHAYEDAIRCSLARKSAAGWSDCDVSAEFRVINRDVLQRACDTIDMKGLRAMPGSSQKHAHSGSAKDTWQQGSKQQWDGNKHSAWQQQGQKRSWGNGGQSWANKARKY